MALWMAMRAIGSSRTSPTKVTLGSCRRTWRRAKIKVTPFLVATWVWLIPSSWYSTRVFEGQNVLAAFVHARQLGHQLDESV